MSQEAALGSDPAHDAQLSDVFFQLTLAVASQIRMEDVLDEILRQTRQLTGCDAVNIALLKGDKLVIRAALGYPDNSELLRLSPLLTDLPLEITSIGTRQPVLIPCTAQDPRWRYLEPVGWIQSYLGLPVIAHEQVLGFLRLDSAQPGFFVHEHIPRLQPLTVVAALAITNAQTYERAQAEIDQHRRTQHALQETNRELDVIARVLTAATQRPSQQQLLQHICQELSAALGIDSAVGGLLTADAKRSLCIIAEYSAPHVPSILGLTVPLVDNPWTQRLMTSPQPQVAEDALTHPDFAHLGDLMRLRGTCSIIVAPLMVQERFAGLVVLDSSTPRRFSEAEIRLVTMVTQAASPALHNAHVYEDLEREFEVLDESVQQQARELENTAHRIFGVLNGSIDPILLVTSSGVVEMANPAFYRHFNTPEVNRVGSLMEYIAPVDQPRLENALSRLNRVALPGRLELECVRADSSTFPADIALSRVSESDISLGIVIIIRDISEQKRAEYALREALIRERELNELKVQFVATASHEFRTPLAIIRTTTDLLRQYRSQMSSEQINDRLDKIERQIAHLTNLLDDVLSLNRARGEDPKLDPQPVEVDAMIERILAELPDEVYHRGRVNYRGQPHMRLLLDAKVVRKALMPLLQNALRYSSPQSAVEVWLEVDDEVQIVIRDYGVGIPPDDQAHLFDAFYRGSNISGQAGTGLGLTIAQNACRQHGGQITFESVPDEGTTFVLHLPALLDVLLLEEDGS